MRDPNPPRGAAVEAAKEAAAGEEVAGRKGRSLFIAKESLPHFQMVENLETLDHENVQNISSLFLW